MNMKIISGLMALFLAVLAPAAALGAEASGEPANKKEVANSVRESVKADTKKKTDDARRELTEEAGIAIQETRNALAALGKKDGKGALASLEKAAGKLSVVLARKPELALAPIDMVVTTHDLYTTLDGIQEAKGKLEDDVEEGRLPEARRLLDGLASEVRVKVTNIPLASYPAAIKAVPPLIDAGKFDEAKAALDAALNTLVVTERIIPLPVLRAQAMLEDAKALSEKKQRSDEENKKLAGLISNARYQLKMGKALGYGDREDFNGVFAQLDEIETKTTGGKFGVGFFDAIEVSLANIRQKIFK